MLGRKKIDIKDKYYKIFGDRISKKGSGNVNPYGEPNHGGAGFFLRGNSYTDPESAVMKISFPLNGKKHFLNCEGIPKQGELLVKTEIKGKNKKLYVALDRRISARADWSKDNRAIEFEDYICSQFSYCIERNDTYTEEDESAVYTTHFDRIPYSILLKFAEEDKNFALDLLSVSNGCKKTLESLFKKVEKDRKKD